MTDKATLVSLIIDGVADMTLDMAVDGIKPNYPQEAVGDSIVIFQSVIMDKLYDLQELEGMSQEQREKMATKCGEDLRKFVNTYTGIDTHKLWKQ